jgi:hypothetical protein
MRKISRKSVALAAGVVLVAAGGGVAYAYWTVGGSGSGSGAAGTNSAITVVQTSTVTAMAPGVAAQPLSGVFNNGNASTVHVTTVAVSVLSVTDAALPGGQPVVGCSGADYTITGSPVTVNVNVPTGSAQSAWSGLSIAFNSTAANQDACKGVTVNLAYVAA